MVGVMETGMVSHEIRSTNISPIAHKRELLIVKEEKSAKDGMVVATLGQSS